MTAWEVNPGLAPLIHQLEMAHPGIVIGTIGDAAHRAEKSDHNPNAAGRVNAADLMIGPHFLESAAGALLPWLVRDARTHYVIHNRKIWTTETRAWLVYGGTDPHTNHIHLSVIDAAYKNTKPWVISPPKPEDNVNVDDLLKNTAKAGTAPETPLGHYVLSQGVPDGLVGGTRAPFYAAFEALGAAVLDLHHKIDDLNTRIDQLIAKQPPA